MDDPTIAISYGQVSLWVKRTINSTTYAPTRLADIGEVWVAGYASFGQKTLHSLRG